MSGRFGAIKRALDPSNIPDLPSLGGMKKGIQDAWNTLSGNPSTPFTIPTSLGKGRSTELPSPWEMSGQTTMPGATRPNTYYGGATQPGAGQPGTMGGTILPGRTQSGTTGGGTIPDPWVTGNTGNNGVYYGPGVRKPDTSDPWAVFNPTTNSPSRTSSRPSSPTRTGTYNPTGGYMTGYRKGASGGRTPTGGGDVGMGQRIGEFVGRNRIPLAGVGLATGTAAGMTGLANTGFFDQSDQSNPRPTTPTPAEDAGSVSPTAPVGNRATRSMGEARPAPTPKPSAQSDGNFISRATDGLNRFIQERVGGKDFNAPYSGAVKVTDAELKYMDSPEFNKGITNMASSKVFKWGGVDRQWSSVDRDKMRQAGVSEADLIGYVMQSEPQGAYKYRGSNQVQINSAVNMANDPSYMGGGRGFYVPTALGKGDILNEYLQKRLAQKGMKR